MPWQQLCACKNTLSAYCYMWCSCVCFTVCILEPDLCWLHINELFLLCCICLNYYSFPLSNHRILSPYCCYSFNVYGYLTGLFLQRVSLYLSSWVPSVVSVDRYDQGLCSCLLGIGTLSLTILCLAWTSSQVFRPLLLGCFIFSLVIYLSCNGGWEEWPLQLMWVWSRQLYTVYWYIL